MNKFSLAGFLVLSAALVVPRTAVSQVVGAPYAQYLITSTMSSHPELQKMGIHVTPPSGKDDIIIACSVPSKIGKKSSPGDLEVEHAGKPSVKTVADQQFYDLALPLGDAQRRPIGMIVMEMRFAGASSADDSVAKAQAITHSIESQVPQLQALFDKAPRSAVLNLLRTTPLPGIVGDFDHFAVNTAANRLYLSAEEHHSIEVFNLKTGEHLQSVTGVNTPHTLAFVPEKNELLIADGGDSSCRIFDVTNMQEVARIPLEADPDAGYYDAQSRTFYVGNGGKGAKQAFSYVTAVSVDQRKVVGRIRVESSNLEAMALDQKDHLLFVNMRDKGAIGLLDLAAGSVKQVWPIAGLKLNTTMAFDSDHSRLFVAGRQPGKVWIIDSHTGNPITSQDCVERADDMTYDPATKRIYVTGAGGITILHQDSPDTYSKVNEFDTNGGKTSVLVSKLKQLYIVHSKTPIDGAALQVYATN